MPTQQQANKVNAACGGFFHTAACTTLEREARAQIVLARATSSCAMRFKFATPAAVAAAQAKAPYWRQGPADYLDTACMIEAAAAALVDVHPLLKLAERVAALNPDAERIGPGMLAQLVDEARRALEPFK